MDLYGSLALWMTFLLFLIFQIISSLSYAQYNASLLEMPRVNIILFDDLAKAVYTKPYKSTNLLHTVVILKPKPLYRHSSTVSISCRWLEICDLKWP